MGKRATGIPTTGNILTDLAFKGLARNKLGIPRKGTVPVAVRFAHGPSL
jgi:hypothetical protein